MNVYKSAIEGTACQTQNITEKGNIVALTILNDRATIDQSKKPILPFHIFKKKINSTIVLLSLGVYAPGPQVLTYRPHILREFESELRPGFLARNGELKGSGVSSSKAITLRSRVLDQN